MKILESGINREPYAEDVDEIKDPIQQYVSNNRKDIKSISEFVHSHYQELLMKYPEYEGFKYVVRHKYYSCGGYSSWFDLKAKKRKEYTKRRLVV